jgi:hypothetical protein
MNIFLITFLTSNVQYHYEAFDESGRNYFVSHVVILKDIYFK